MDLVKNNKQKYVKKPRTTTLPINPWYLGETKEKYPKKIKKILKQGYGAKFKIPYPEPDLILVIDPVREKFDFRGFPKAKTAYYAIDSHLKLDKHLEKAEVKNYDFLFVAHKDYIPYYQEAGCRNVYWLPLAGDEDIHRYHNLPLLYDLCFLAWTEQKWRKNWKAIAGASGRSLSGGDSGVFWTMRSLNCF